MQARLDAVCKACAQRHVPLFVGLREARQGGEGEGRRLTEELGRVGAPSVMRLFPRRWWMEDGED
eukprot:13454093-Alexandrium_andersonii.AAC.1